MQDYKQLQIWKNGIYIAREVYNITKAFPLSEQFGITSQIKKAAISISSNIAEGSSRISKKDFYRFLEIALGSLFEVETQLILSEELKFIDHQKITGIIAEIESEKKMLYVFMNKVIGKEKF
jgi:four helix bundle protein